MNEESPPDVAVSTKVHKVKIDDRFKDDALEKVRALVKGNGLDPQEVTLASFDGELLHFEAHTDLVVVTKFAKKTIPGRMTGPVAVANETALQEAINNEYLTLFTDADSQRKIREIFLNREDQGFGINDVFMQIPFWKKEFVIFEPCQTCRNTGKILCRTCGGKGILPCTRCAGSGMTFCSHCNGARTVQNSQGQRMQCPVCHGQGRTSCNQCQQSGRMQCRICSTKGSTQCPNCQGHAWSSNLTIVNIEAKTRFEYPKEELPDKVVLMIEEYGDKIKEHAKIHLMESKTNELKEIAKEEDNAQEVAEKQKILHIPIFYEVSLPYGHFEFDIKGTSYYTFLFGIKGSLSHVSPFLDDLIKNGLRKLQDAVDERGDVTENLKAAAAFRCIRRGILYGSKFSAGKAARKLEKDFPFGLSKETLDIITVSADKALKNLSKRPRNKGLALSGVFMGSTLGAYFLSPARGFLAKKMPSIGIEAALDMIILCGILYIGTMIIQTFANKGINALLQTLTGAKEKSAFGAAKLGDSVFKNAAIGLLLFFIVIEMTVHIDVDIPSWYKIIRG